MEWFDAQGALVGLAITAGVFLAMALAELVCPQRVLRHPKARRWFTNLALFALDSVLVRLAMGAMIAEKGNEVPIILDDALVFSDDARIEQMFDALNRAGRRQQVIVFTCRAASFASLGGRPLSIA